MKSKKIIILTITTLLILSQMIIPLKAATNYNLVAIKDGEVVNFTWSAVAGVKGYNIYVNTANKGYEFIGSVKSPKASIIGFETDKNYKAKISPYKLNSNGEKVEIDTSEEVEINYNLGLSIAIDKVKNLSVSQSEGNRVYLEWTEISDVTGYQVYAYVQGFGYMWLGDVAANSVFLKNSAEVGTNYKFKIRAYKKSGDSAIYGDFSDEVELTIKDTNKVENKVEEKVENTVDQKTEEKVENKVEQKLELSKVTNVKVDELKDDKVTIEWDKVKNATGYEVWLKKGTAKYKKQKTTTKTYATISDLDYDTKYRVIIVAYNDEQSEVVYSPDSKAVTFETEEDIIDVVRTLKTEVVDGNSVSLSWSKVSNAEGYDIFVAEGNKSFKYKKTVTKTSTVIEDLKYDTTYKVKVRAFGNIHGKDKTGDYSPVKTFVTDEEQKLTQVQRLCCVPGPEKQVVYLNWNDVTGADGYEIVMTIPGLAGESKIQTKTSYKTVSGITYKDAEYTVKVRAYKIVNGKYVYGEYSEVKKFTGSKAIY